MTAVHQVLAASAHALPALQIARLAGVQIEDAYAELVALEGRGAAKVEPCRGEWLWRLVPMAGRQ